MSKEYIDTGRLMPSILMNKPLEALINREKEFIDLIKRYPPSIIDRKTVLHTRLIKSHGDC